ncbi:MAG: DUF3006 domain-containing protein [[Clostridium] leptum]
MFAISLNELPQGAKPGDVLQISGAGELSVDQETQRRRKKWQACKASCFVNRISLLQFQKGEKVRLSQTKNRRGLIFVFHEPPGVIRFPVFASLQADS